MGYTRNGSVLNNNDSSEYKAAMLRSKREQELQTKFKDVDLLLQRIEKLEKDMEILRRKYDEHFRDC